MPSPARARILSPARARILSGSALESATDITANNRAYFANLSKGAGRLATGLSIMTTAYSLNSAFDQFNAGGLDEVFLNNRDVYDATVGIAGLTASAGLAFGFGAANVWNPIGWIAIGYAVVTIVYDLSKD